MATLTVRLDAETKAALDDIRSATGMTITEVVKQGVHALRERVEANPPPQRTPYEYYRTLTLAAATGRKSTRARDSRHAVREAIKAKLQRKRKPR